MNPYLIAMIVFGVLLGIVYMIVGRPSTVYLPVDEGVQEDIETRKKKAQKVRSKRWVIGMGGVMGACMLTMFGIWIVEPARTVYGAFNPTSTPTIVMVTAMPTSTPTRAVTATPRMTATPRSTATLSAGNFLTKLAGSPAPTIRPVTPSSGGASVPVVVYRTVVVVSTRIVIQLVPVTVVVTATPIPVDTFTPSATFTPIETPTATLTPSATPSPTQTCMAIVTDALGTPSAPIPCTETPTATPTETIIP